MPLFLIGYMGSGKSTLGRGIAAALGWRFIDTDKEIERREGLSVSEIFATLGEKAFRKMEHDLIASISPDEQAVVSTGGGAPCHFDNMERMNRTGLTVRLECCRERLVRRLAEAGGVRPMFADIATDPAAIDRRVDSLSAEREPFYAQAAATFDSSRLESSEETDSTVAKFISRFANPSHNE